MNKPVHDNYNLHRSKACVLQTTKVRRQHCIKGLSFIKKRRFAVKVIQRKRVGMKNVPLEANNERQPHLPEGDGKLFVIALRCGRLANRLVLFTNFIAFAEEYGHRVINFTFHSFADLFETTRRDIYCRYPIVKRQSMFDLVPLVGGTIRKTRVFYHLTRAATVLNGKYPVFGRRVVTLRELPREDMTPLEGPEVQARIADARVVLAYDWRFRAPACVMRHA